MSPAPVASPLTSGPEPRPRPRHRTPLAVAVLLVTALVSALAVPVDAQDAPETDDPAEAAAGWLARQLVDGERFEIDFGDVFPDQGLTIDAILALTGAGVADDFAAAATDWLTQPEIYQGYLGFGPGAAGKFAVAVLARGLDPADFPDGDGNSAIDIILAADDGDYFGSAINVGWAIFALHLAGEVIPEGLADLLLSLQCEDGSFGDPFASGDPCPGGSDYTSFAVQALVLLEGTDAGAAAAATQGDATAAATQSEIDAALAAAVADLLDRQGGDGALGNANSTGLGAQAFAAAGEADAAAAAAGFLVSIQLGCAVDADDRGAFPVDGSADARATAQAVLGVLLLPVAAVTSGSDALGPAPVLACAPAGGPGPSGGAPPAGEAPVPGAPAGEVEEAPAPVPEARPATAAQATPTFAG